MLQDIQKENGVKTVAFNIHKDAVDLLSKMNSKKVNTSTSTSSSTTQSHTL